MRDEGPRTDPGSDGAGDPVAERVQTWCHDCGGRGAKWMARAATVQRLAATAAQMQHCMTCGGSGRLPGMQRPV